MDNPQTSSSTSGGNGSYKTEEIQQKEREFYSIPTILSQIFNKQLDPTKIDWPRRKLCIKFLLIDQKYTIQEISQIMRVHPATVYEVRKIVRASQEHLVDEITEKNVAATLINTAEVAAARLFKKGREAAAWRVVRELTESLQSMGFITRKPIEFEGHLTLPEFIKFVNTRYVRKIIQVDGSVSEEEIGGDDEIKSVEGNGASDNGDNGHV